MRLVRIRRILLAVVMGPAKEPGVQNDDSGRSAEEGPTPGRRFTWAGGRDVTLHWKLPAPGV